MYIHITEWLSSFGWWTEFTCCNVLDRPDYCEIESYLNQIKVLHKTSYLQYNYWGGCFHLCLWPERISFQISFQPFHGYLNISGTTVVRKTMGFHLNTIAVFHGCRVRTSTALSRVAVEIGLWKNGSLSNLHIWIQFIQKIFLKKWIQSPLKRQK